MAVLRLILLAVIAATTAKVAADPVIPAGAITNVGNAAGMPPVGENVSPTQIDQLLAENERLKAKVAIGAAQQAAYMRADDCQTVKELLGWREEQIKKINERVPFGFQQFPVQQMNGDFKKRLDSLRADGLTNGNVSCPPDDVAAALDIVVAAGLPTAPADPKAAQGQQSSWTGMQGGMGGMQGGIPGMSGGIPGMGGSQGGAAGGTQGAAGGIPGMSGGIPGMSAGGSQGAAGGIPGMSGGIPGMGAMSGMQIPMMQQQAGGQTSMVAPPADPRIAQVQQQRPMQQQPMQQQPMQQQPMQQQRPMQQRPMQQRPQVPPRAEEDFPQDCALLTRGAAMAPGQTAALPVLLMQSDMCATVEDLDVWRACQLNEIQFNVPPGYRPIAVNRVQHQVEKRLSEIMSRVQPVKNGPDQQSLPVFLAVAHQCKTEKELQMWHGTQLQQVEHRFSPQFRNFASGAVEGTFQGCVGEMRHAKIMAGQHKGAHAGAAAKKAPMSLSGEPAENPEEDGEAADWKVGASWVALAFVVVGMAVPARNFFCPAKSAEAASLIRQSEAWTMMDDESKSIQLMPV